MTRASDQIKADGIDLDLYRLIARIDVKQSPAWAEIALGLAAVRTKVRALMHPDDRKATA